MPKASDRQVSKTDILMAYFFHPFGNNMQRQQYTALLVCSTAKLHFSWGFFFSKLEARVIEKQIAYTLLGIEAKTLLGRRKYI